MRVVHPLVKYWRGLLLSCWIFLLLQEPKPSPRSCCPSAKPCSYPGDLANGRLVEMEQFAFGSIANYSCDMG